MNMDLDSLQRLPIVYTTRLDEMTILRNDLSLTSSKDIIQAIIFESKPQYEENVDKLKVLNIKHEIDRHAGKNNKKKLRKHGYVRKNKNLKLRFEELKAKLKVIESKSQERTKGINQFDSLLGLCKPLKIVLEDIYKIKPKLNDEMNTEVFIISSDSDDDVVINGENTFSKRVTLTGRRLVNPIIKHTVRNKNKFQALLAYEDLQDTVMVIYNLYLKEFDAYQIGQNYNVTLYRTGKYTDVYKFQVKKCKVLINVVACCWKNRQSYILILLTYKKYIDIARYIGKSHSCKETCTCCCDILQKYSQVQDAVDKPIENDIVIDDSLVNDNHFTHRKRPKLIDLALTFEKKSKWKGYSQKTCNESVNNQRICKTLLQLNNTKGEVEFYEFGNDNLIYSKIVNNAADKTSWLYKTMSQCRNHYKFIFTNRTEREKKIIAYECLNNIISKDTKCFLRKPIPTKPYNTSNLNSDIDQSSKYKAEHIKSRMGEVNKNSKVLPNLSEIRNNKVPPPVGRPRQPRRRRQKQSTVMDQEVSQTVNCLIKDILHRFRNVLLTINSDGKVAAALNAPLSSLSQDELKILSQILSHAQSQVDKLGLTPGTCLNPDTPMLINSTEKNSTSSTDTTDLNAVDATSSEKGDVAKKQSSKEKKKSDNSKVGYLRNFSAIIVNKKEDYKTSLRRYLGDTLNTTPKITNVFSLSNANSVTTNILQGQGDASSVNTPKTFINEMGTTTIYDHEIASMSENKRKRKTSLTRSDEPKIKIKTSAEININNSPPITFLQSRNVQNIECDLTPSVPSTSLVTPDSNDVVDNIPLNCVKDEIITFEDLPLTEQLLQVDTKPFFKEYIENTVIESTTYSKS